MNKYELERNSDNLSQIICATQFFLIKIKSSNF